MASMESNGDYGEQLGALGEKDRNNKRKRNTRFGADSQCFQLY